MPFSVLIVDDQPAVLQLLTLWIEGDDRLSLAGTAQDGEAAVRWVRSRCPDAVICDLVMPVMDGIEALPLLRRACPDAVIAMYTSCPEVAGGAEQLGADAVFDKATEPSAMLDHLVNLCRIRSG